MSTDSKFKEAMAKPVYPMMAVAKKKINKKDEMIKFMESMENPASEVKMDANAATVAATMEAIAAQHINAANQGNAPAAPKRPSLRSFVNTGEEFEGSEWTSTRIREAIDAEHWRQRDIDETIREGDLVCFEGDNISFERASGWKDVVITQEQVDLHGFTVFTLEGGGKKRKPVIIHETTEFKEGLLSVPKGMLVKLPTDEAEAKRFFACDVIITEVAERGKMVKCFYPIPSKMADKKFRQIFSRVFPEFAKKHFREHIKGLIEGRGLGVRFKRGISTRKILKFHASGMNAEQIAIKLNIPFEPIVAFLNRQDYHRREGGTIPFKDRMAARKLDPVDFKYEKALGIEIETISTVSDKDAQKRVPSFMRCAIDGSIRDMAGNKPAGNGTWGVEFRILIKRAEMETRILKAVEAISKLECKVNKSCGLHVHFDMRDKTLPEVTILHERLTRWLSVLRELIPPSRRENMYCAFENADSPHHMAVSIDAYKKHKTLEVRVHSSTLNHIKIIQWIRLIETIIETKFIPLTKTSTLDALKMLNLTEADRTYWLKRHQHLNPNLYKSGKLDLSFLGEKHDEVE